MYGVRVLLDRMQNMTKESSSITVYESVSLKGTGPR